MQSISTIGLDITRSVFQAHGVDAGGQAKASSNAEPTAPCARRRRFLVVVLGPDALEML